MGKGWDNSGIAFQKETWEKCLKALKPWWYLLAFGGSRTYHRIACAIEDAGFEIRDCIMWLYWSWFPKSMNIWLAIDKKNWVESKVVGRAKWAWSVWNNEAGNQTFVAKNQYSDGTHDIKEAQNERKGWWTALKPSYEPIIVARKPLEWSCTDNVIKYWVGGINIDECRVETDDKLVPSISWWSVWLWEKIKWHEYTPSDLWRFPANTILTYSDEDKEEVCSWFPNAWKWNNKWAYNYAGKEYNNSETSMFNWDKPQAPSNYNDSGSAARYFYCAKASKRDRDEWLDGFETKTKVFNWQSDKPSTDMKDVEKRFTTVGRNTHPTVKPTDLMQYLVRLVTPNGWTVLDPFNWSGSTWKAVMYENKDRNKWYKYIWIELTEEYLPIAKARIEYVINKDKWTNLFN